MTFSGALLAVTAGLRDGSRIRTGSRLTGLDVRRDEVVATRSSGTMRPPTRSSPGCRDGNGGHNRRDVGDQGGAISWLHDHGRVGDLGGTLGGSAGRLNSCGPCMRWNDHRARAGYLRRRDTRLAGGRCNRPRSCFWTTCRARARISLPLAYRQDLNSSPLSMIRADST